MKKIKIALLGGDKRLAVLADFLCEKGFYVECYGIDTVHLSDRVVEAESVGKAISDSSVVVLPLPMSGDGVHISCPLMKNGDAPEIKDILEKSKGRLIYGGRLSPQIKKLAETAGVEIVDYFDLEELKIRNSVLASEGAMSIAMNRLDRAVFGSKSAVIGYGRLGKTLAPMLKALGSRVTVAARKSTDIAWAAAYGFDTLRIGYEGGATSLKKLADGYDVIFNTAPYWLIDDTVLKVLQKNTIIVDLASAPGGVDPAAAERYGIEVIPALSLPGKYAPVSAGELIGEYLFEMISKELNL